MPITMFSAGQECTIVHISGSAEVKRRLCDMGISEGSRLRVMSCVHGNVIVEAKNTRFAIDENLAKKIKAA